jgi:hypothetical protein
MGRSAGGVFERTRSGGVLGASTPGSYQHHAACSNWAAGWVVVKFALLNAAVGSASWSTCRAGLWRNREAVRLE